MSELRCSREDHSLVIEHKCPVGGEDFYWAPLGVALCRGRKKLDEGSQVLCFRTSGHSDDCNAIDSAGNVLFWPFVAEEPAVPAAHSFSVTDRWGAFVLNQGGLIGN